MQRSLDVAEYQTRRTPSPGTPWEYKPCYDRCFCGGRPHAARLKATVTLGTRRREKGWKTSPAAPVQHRRQRCSGHGAGGVWLGGGGRRLLTPANTRRQCRWRMRRQQGEVSAAGWRCLAQAPAFPRRLYSEEEQPQYERASHTPDGRARSRAGRGTALPNAGTGTEVCLPAQRLIGSANSLTSSARGRRAR